MELIIKTTGRCNFACNFCLAGKADIMHLEHVPDELTKIIGTLKPSVLIMNGGEPLLSGRDFFFELLDRYDGHVAIVSNLKDFYKRPEYWKDLFKHPRVSITTSFQFGSGRRWDRETPYDVEKFKDVMTLFGQKVGYLPMFISVISGENERFALDHVYLAKELGTVCKLNPMLPLGISSETYPFYKMVDIWMEIKNRDLERYTDCNVQFYDGGCSFNTCLLCNSTIRVVFLDSSGHVRYSNCESKAMLGRYLDVDRESPTPCKQRIAPSDYVCKDCIQCRLCRLCNGCDISRELNKKDPSYCSEMKKRESEILKMGWFI